MQWFFCFLPGNNLLNRSASNLAFVEWTIKVLTRFPAAAQSVWLFMLCRGEIRITKTPVAGVGLSHGLIPPALDQVHRKLLLEDLVSPVSMPLFFKASDSNSICHSWHSSSLALSSHLKLCFAPSPVTCRCKNSFTFPGKYFSPL